MLLSHTFNLWRGNLVMNRMIKRCTMAVFALSVVFCAQAAHAAVPLAPPTQCVGGVLGLRIIFPDCVARDPATGGQRLDSPTHRTHMARSKLQNGARVCPSAYPIPVPTLTINANFPMPTTSGTVSLSSDQAGDAPGSSIHTDFWNTWDQDAPLNLSPPDGCSYGGLNALVKHCINEIPPDQVRPTECRAPTATS